MAKSESSCVLPNLEEFGNSEIENWKRSLCRIFGRLGIFLAADWSEIQRIERALQDSK